MGANSQQTEIPALVLADGKGSQAVKQQQPVAAEGSVPWNTATVKGVAGDK